MYLAHSGLLPCSARKKFPENQIINLSFHQAFLVNMAGYWPRSFFASLWTSTSSRSMNTQKKNMANIQPSWPHTWSITHTYFLKYHRKKTALQRRGSITASLVVLFTNYILGVPCLFVHTKCLKYCSIFFLTHTSPLRYN